MGSHDRLRTRPSHHESQQPHTGPTAASSATSGQWRRQAGQRASARAWAQRNGAGAFLCTPAVGMQTVAAVSEGCARQKGGQSEPTVPRSSRGRHAPSKALKGGHPARVRRVQKQLRAGFSAVHMIANHAGRGLSVSGGPLRTQRGAERQSTRNAQHRARRCFEASGRALEGIYASVPSRNICVSASPHRAPQG